MRIKKKIHYFDIIKANMILRDPSFGRGAMYD